MIESLRTLWIRLRALFDKSAMDRELDEELRYHVERRAEQLVASGVDATEARRLALVELGGFEETKEAVREQRGVRLVERSWQDVRFGARALMRHKSFTVTAVVALALGIGANTAVFSAVDAVLLKPLPYPDSERLVVVQEARDGDGYGISYPNFLDLRSRAASYDSLAVYLTSNGTLTAPGEAPEQLCLGIVSENLFDVLGVEPRHGRAFLPGEDRLGASPVGRPVVLADAFWKRRFGGDPNVLGRAITYDDVAYVVVGVMPPGFQFPVQNEPVDLWTTVAVDADPMLYEGTIPTSRGYPRYDAAIGRLRPETTLEQARAEAASIGEGLLAENRSLNSDWRLAATPALDRLVGASKPAIGALFAAVCVVLLIACANVANLMLVRATSRYGELAVRTALGASRPRLVRQLLTESLMLAIVGGAAGFAVAYLGVAALGSLVPDDVPRVAEIAVDWRVAVFTLAISLVAGLAFGVAPALGASKVDLTTALKEGGRGADGSVHGALRTALVVGEVALTLVLLVGAGLLVYSFARLASVDPGFESGNVLTARVSLPESVYPNGTPNVTAFYDGLLARLRTQPGVRAASVAQVLPLSGANNSTSVEVVGVPVSDRERPQAGLRLVGVDYFRTLAIPLVRGRDFDGHDGPEAGDVAVVNEAFVRRFLPDGDPIGHRIKLGFGGDGPKEIVGVVRDVHHAGLGEAPVAEMYVPIAQFPMNTLSVLVRTEGDPRGASPAIQREVQALDRNLPVVAVRTLDEYLAGSVSRPRFAAYLVGVVAAVALALAALGVYGVVSYRVAQRTREIGIRTALGAGTGAVLRMVVRQGMAPVVVGMALGVVGAVALSRVVATLLYEGDTGVALVCAVAVGVLGASALMACYVPARRAARVDPVTALRAE